MNAAISDSIREKVKSHGFKSLTLAEIATIEEEYVDSQFEHVFKHYIGMHESYKKAYAHLEKLCRQINEDTMCDEHSQLQRDLARYVMGEKNLLTELKTIFEEEPTFHNMRILSRVLHATRATLENPEDPDVIKSFSKMHADLDGKVTWQHRVETGVSVMLGIILLAGAALCAALCFVMTPAFIIPAGILIVLGAGMLASARAGWENEARWRHHHAQPKVMQATLFYHQHLQHVARSGLRVERRDDVHSPSYHAKRD